MSPKNHIKYILFMVCIGSISLVLIGFIIENKHGKTVVDTSHKVIVETPKGADIPSSNRIVNGEGTRVDITAESGSLVQPLPIPSPDKPIEFIFLR